MERIGINRLERIVAARYINRFRLVDTKVEIARLFGNRVLYLIGTNRSGYIYRIRFDKVKALMKPIGQQIINKLFVFLKQAKIVHGDKYDYSLVKEEDLTYENKFTVICPLKGHGKFQTHRSRHIEQRKGCPVCGRRNRRRKNNFK